IIGSGTLLDTSRLRYALSEHFEVAQRNMHAYVFGEHGDTSFVPWSMAKISGATFDEFIEMMKSYDKNIEPLDRDAMEEYIHTSGGEIIANKGATYYAVSVAVCRLCSILLSAYDSVVTVSTMMHGEYGIEDVCVSVPNIIGPDGAKGKVPVKLTEEEVAKLHRSANVLKDIIKDLVL
ncbi:MAG: L-lactate dehydrogenase, partial [Clostridia bacterium]|nr:L-lactate dehydrogenase [Clostridia bacterium]